MPMRSRAGSGTEQNNLSYSVHGTDYLQQKLSTPMNDDRIQIVNWHLEQIQNAQEQVAEA